MTLIILNYFLTLVEVKRNLKRTKMCYSALMLYVSDTHSSSFSNNGLLPKTINSIYLEIITMQADLTICKRERKRFIHTYS